MVQELSGIDHVSAVESLAEDLGACGVAVL